MRLLLASASPARLATLRAAHIDPLVQVADVPEDELLAAMAQASPAHKVNLLARAKAEKIAASNPRADLVLGCDSMFEMDGELVGKPKDREQAHARLTKMSGRSGLLYTGHHLIETKSGAAAFDCSVAEVFIAQLSPAEIAAYIDTGEPLAVAGSFTIDGYGGPFVEKVVGDHHGVVGVSLPLVRRLMRELGHEITEYWVS